MSKKVFVMSKAYQVQNQKLMLSLLNAEMGDNDVQ